MAVQDSRNMSSPERPRCWKEHTHEDHRYDCASAPRFLYSFGESQQEAVFREPELSSVSESPCSVDVQALDDCFVREPDYGSFRRGLGPALHAQTYFGQARLCEIAHFLGLTGGSYIRYPIPLATRIANRFTTLESPSYQPISARDFPPCSLIIPST